MSSLDCQYSAPRKRGPKSKSSGRATSVQSNLLHPSDASPEAFQEALLLDANISTSLLSPALSVQSPLLALPRHGRQATPDDSTPVDSLFHAAYHDSSKYALWPFLAEIRNELSTLNADISLLEIVRRCIDAYVSFLFPIAPIIHEQSLRDAARLLAALNNDETSLPQSHTRESLERLRQFALLTAVCAEVGYMLPPNLCPIEMTLAATFFRISTQALTLCRDADMQNLNSSSLITRYFHCNCTHAIGQISKSWVIMGETIRLALHMRLHEEETYTNMTNIERQLCRNIFWQLYTADKSSSLLNIKSFMLHDLLLCEEITTQPPQPFECKLLSVPGARTEHILIIGFNTCQNIFRYAFELCLEMKLSKRYDARATMNIHEMAMAGLYFSFNTALDDIPSELREYPSTSIEGALPTMFDIQAANLVVTRHCLRLLILQQCAKYELHHVLGFPQDRSLLELRRLEIARDFIEAIRVLPFEALRVNGEPSNEKIRQVGACLLEMQYEAHEPLNSARASQELETLLNILSRLDSRASQTLLASREILSSTASNDPS